MNLSSIIMLLHIVLSMLSQPGASSNVEVQRLASQAIGLANTALQQPPVSSTPNQPNPIGSPDITSVETPAIPTLASSPYCQNVDPQNVQLVSICSSTSTDMCTYQKTPSHGGGTVQMQCVEIRLCSLEHTCP